MFRCLTKAQGNLALLGLDLNLLHNDNSYARSRRGTRDETKSYVEIFVLISFSSLSEGDL